MSRDLKRVLEGLEDARAFAAGYRFVMTDEYRTLILQVEQLPRNAAGADRSDRWLGSRAVQEALRARAVPRFRKP